MTGYGRYESSWNDIKLSVEIRAVNHRFCEIAVRLPRHLMFLEDNIKKRIQQKVQRGRIDVYMTFNTESLVKKSLKVDWELAKAYCLSVKEMRDRLDIEGEVSVQDMLGIQDLFQIEEELSDDEYTYRNVLLQAVDQATDELVKMRTLEGKALTKDLQMRISKMQGLLEQIKVQAPNVKDQYAKKLEGRVKEWLPDAIDADQSRLLTEVALFAEKADISEEITRLESHYDQFLHNLEQTEPVGRKLDFLIQEMNREMNTIGSKANDIDISQSVVELKSELEKLREQVQNVE
ncbi:YicC/YloC family endoribonuclease [Caldalkalibacillus salinus]|uniref:YicC/YloC family endoribonuclease n=1 Tax=Caldalkalibacillus salinus TaxID=2803787 RepID=UPI0019250B09|nr:YicC/YloC family endoribonuclease [Caldalkalibacillus salinus]